MKTRRARRVVSGTSLPPQSHMVGASCGVLLLDEVDAALDEANQHLVGGWVGGWGGRKAGRGGMQCKRAATSR